jgi:hypothetical protein
MISFSKVCLHTYYNIIVRTASINDSQIHFQYLVLFTSSFSIINIIVMVSCISSRPVHCYGRRVLREFHANLRNLHDFSPNNGLYCVRQEGGVEMLCFIFCIRILYKLLVRELKLSLKFRYVCNFVSPQDKRISLYGALHVAEHSLLCCRTRSNILLK